MPDKKLFEQPLMANPAYQDMENRIAFGRAGNATKNMTLNQLRDWLNGLLNFLRPSSNLNDLQNKDTARNNLNVYSKDEVYNKSEIDYSLNVLNNKFGGITILGGGLIIWSNTPPYVSWTNLFGSLNITQVSRISTGKYLVTHNLGGYNYQVIAFVDTTDFTGNPELKIARISRSDNLFEIITSEANTPNDLETGQRIFCMLIAF